MFWSPPQCAKCPWKCETFSRGCRWTSLSVPPSVFTPTYNKVKVTQKRIQFSTRPTRACSNSERAGWTFSSVSRYLSVSSPRSCSCRHGESGTKVFLFFECWYNFKDTSELLWSVCFSAPAIDLYHVRIRRFPVAMTDDTGKLSWRTHIVEIRKLGRLAWYTTWRNVHALRKRQTVWKCVHYCSYVIGCAWRDARWRFLKCCWLVEKNDSNKTPEKNSICGSRRNSLNKAHILAMVRVTDNDLHRGVSLNCKK